MREFSEVEKQTIHQRMVKLEIHPRDMKVLRLYFGLGEDPTRQSLEEIGRSMGITRERIRQLRDRALLRIRDLDPELLNLIQREPGPEVA